MELLTFGILFGCMCVGVLFAKVLERVDDQLFEGQSVKMMGRWSLGSPGLDLVFSKTVARAVADTPLPNAAV